MGVFPDDETVRFNARLIRMIDQLGEQKHRTEVSALLKGLMHRG